MITELNERSRAIFEFIVDTYLSTGLPVGSRTISRESPLALSPASIRNTMSDLEHLGLLFAPHTSAGRMPTQKGLRLYIDGIMNIGSLSDAERRQINAFAAASGRSLNEILMDISSQLSGLSSCASLVVSPKSESALKQVQFVELSPRKTLIIMLFESGLVENRIIDHDIDIPQSALNEASNYLNHAIKGKTISQTHDHIQKDIEAQKTKLDTLSQDLVKRGLAVPGSNQERIIIRGQARLLEDLKAVQDIERARVLLSYLEENKNLLKVLEAIDKAQGVQIFIGAESEVFDQAGWSLIVSPYHNAEQKIIGAIGVIGPTRLNYDRIIPMVDYTSRMVSKVLDEF